ncbi:hypothetical protein D7X94_14530 [Acutalibacter sp. 1XD8-33]|uniref:hypothetical protein n=1 Tax=Acutalibacter sp. 1XD8-33 TaxID=2320081 RepID=UPI000EA3F483|nr:hypothetical protein [Acutalibacter sp. 1XD8-33]RKJ38866.1 hypothetical protein D7X94_14530 [Acutalibacter sp. 1XD8-33]
MKYRVVETKPSQSISRNVPFTVILPTDGLSLFKPEEFEAREQNPIGRPKLGDVGEVHERGAFGAVAIEKGIYIRKSETQ